MEVMAKRRFRGIEELPDDDLREIMVRVARDPDGARDIARAFAVSQTFLKFSEDRTVLRAVSFRYLDAHISGCYDLVSNVGGLVTRCAIEGNEKAQFILAKVIMVSATMVCNSKYTASFHRFWGPYGDPGLPDPVKATRLLDHFCPWNTDPSELLDFVAYFISRARIVDFVRMHRHLIDLVSLYFVPGTDRELQPFILFLNQLCMKDPFDYVVSPFALNPIVNRFNTLCADGHATFKAIGIDEKVYRPLLQCLIDIRDGDVTFKTVVERLDIIHPILNLRSQMTSTEGMSSEDMTDSVDTLCELLLRHLDHEGSLVSARRSLLDGFLALFECYNPK